jgi:hypothetical protein
MAEVPGQGETALIVVSVTPGSEEAAAGRLAEELSVDPEVMLKAVQSAPILLIGGLTKEEVRSLTPRLQKASQIGIEFRLTQRQPNSLPRVDWPVRPNFALPRTSVDRVLFQWGNNAFVCPGCGETFVFRRTGKLPVAVDAGAAAPAAAPAAAAAFPVVKDQGLPKALGGGMSLGERLRAKGLGVKPSSPHLEPVKEEAKPAAGSSPKLPAVPETPRAEPAAAKAAEPADDLLGDPLADVLADAEPEAGKTAPVSVAKADEGGVEDLLSGDTGDPLDLDAPAETAAPATAPPSGAEAAEIISSMEAVEAPAAGAAAPAPAAADTGERYNVFVSALKDEHLREAAAGLIAQARAVPLAEAKKMVLRPMIKAADRVPRDAADKLVLEFRKLKISARVTKST